jgi:hypothetical protein
MNTVKAFFEFCLSNEWITRNPARLVRKQRGREAADRRGEQKLPFSDGEFRRMYEACETRYGKQEIKWSRTIHHQRVSGEYVRYNYKWTGLDLADFISVSVYTDCEFRRSAPFILIGCSRPVKSTSEPRKLEPTSIRGFQNGFKSVSGLEPAK